MNSYLIERELGYKVKVFKDDEYITVTSDLGVVKFDDELCLLVYEFGNEEFISNVFHYYKNKRRNRNNKFEVKKEWTEWIDGIDI